MIQFDTHIHTYPYSTDSKQSIQEVLAMQEQVGYGFCLTEHMDHLYHGTLSFEFDPVAYFEAYQQYRNDKFLLGIEMGLTSKNLPLVAKTVSRHPFDMVIGSIHTVGDVDISYADYYTGQTKEEAYNEYLSEILFCVTHYDAFDSLGHIDYICRYGKYEDPEMDVTVHKDLLTQIFQVLIQKEKCLEINTRRLDTEAGYHTLNELLSLYAKLGGRLVTVGSDSHRPEHLANHFAKAQKLIETHHFIPVYFKNRQPIYD